MIGRMTRRKGVADVNEIQKELDAAFRMLMRIPVTGDAVEWMAAAKASLRKAYHMEQEREDSGKEAAKGP